MYVTDRERERQKDNLIERGREMERKMYVETGIDRGRQREREKRGKWKSGT